MKKWASETQTCVAVIFRRKKREIISKLLIWHKFLSIHKAF